MNEQQKLENIIINENAYFFSNDNNIRITNSKINLLFREVSSVKSGNYLLKKIRETINVDGINIIYSFCTFKFNSKPTFIDKVVNDWIETKLAYLLIVEVNDHIVISRKNISKVQDFVKQFNALDYSILSTLFVTDETLLEKFNLKNLNVSDKALREKSLEAIDLRENFSALGANNYMLNSLRVNNNDEKISLSLNSSRINKLGRKNSIEQFCGWAKNLIDQINGHTDRATFLSVFAEPQDYESLKDSITPISVLFVFSKLYNDFENGIINRSFIEYIHNDGEIIERNIDLLKHLNKFERLSKVEEDNNLYFINNNSVNDIQLRFNEKSISIRSQKLKSIILERDNGTQLSLIDYINTSGGYVINFENIDLVYSNRKLFKDNRLLGNIEHFMKIFISHPELNNSLSEKGSFIPVQIDFNNNSLFKFVEDTYLNDFDYFICDDLGREWADHIGINEDKIVLFHSKFDTTQFSASAFQDIVGQAQKNLGNVSPQDYQLDGKRDFWNSQYISTTGVATSINRLRKGDNINNAINLYKSATNNPNFHGEVHLVINFISKSNLETNLKLLKANTPFGQRNETIQILWFISSLIASTQEVNTNVFIHTKP
ncbi:MAG: hypothetical protein BGO88_14410 [Flavobacterium sp. 38-13]|uniref:hypothetical protein n=1 Tax=Flavobacterium sp. 38-13 TaxID=1896168 RepID=UPI00095E9936|nr:hypothetical protein [Flavobacterium sp. 38-13]OJX49435.1 MAG: hypothetical protein BGO88_14410 [Flavobacterium sp. 38-13]